MRSNKVTVSKLYSELSRHGKERFRVIVQTPRGKRSIVFNTLAEATRGRQRLEKLHRPDFEKPVAERVEEYQTLALAALFCLHRGTRAAEIMQRCVRDVDDLGRKLIISGAKTQAGNRRLSMPEAPRGHSSLLGIRLSA